MILIKLGGSIVTDKSRPLTASRQTIAKMARVIAKIPEPVMIVHGGGSFGHYWSVKYDMHTKEHSYDTKGVAMVKNSMVQLHTIILEELLRGGLKPYSLAPASFMTGSKPAPSRVKDAGKIPAISDMTPVTYGDALWYGDGGKSGKKDDYKTYILSGDKIMTHLARILRPRLCIFALGEDGLYADLESKKLIRHIPAPAKTSSTRKDAAAAAAAAAANRTGKMAKNVMDVTGGMTRKVSEAAIITKLGTAVAFVNGNYPKRIRDAVAATATTTVAATATNDKFKGTLFEPSNT